ncbi:ribose ABC transporter (ATP-binding protein) [Petrocella atlantisensis]|uniref:Ribose ABC transporter (ATP-binding protein) n=1 Tax=Petrocella atlantisensis TaxID=2173034 RepID=A0A3P7S8R2_9FIRM|nr:sugar ABC transporter ATP-binding protein [Petrocella atlantisensis]PKM54994.1 MAG: D-xylose ABC transporter ATP-binding protein [Firmicutes bacterium HGW-Firmicutes-5]VDN48339.1 ribose ABC transporter (ATP-binding protein) [Petrocella atlantisensis]
MTENNIIELQNISKNFPGVKALEKVNFSLEKGEVHALLGENGAGKSTLIKILTGAYQQTVGTIIFEGKEVDGMTPERSKHLGINAIYQELTLFPDMTVAQNIFMGNEQHQKTLPFLDDRSMNLEATSLFKRIKLNVEATVLLKKLSIAQQQMVEIARALSLNTKVLIMDEPTSSITKQDTEVLFDLIRELRNQGVSIIYISHRMEEILEICDRVTVMRDGKVVKTLPIEASTNTEELVNLMVYKKLKDFFPKVIVSIGEEVLAVDKLSCAGVFNEISFNVRSGEIFGIGGLVGSKRSEVVEAIFGLREYNSGEIRFNGEKLVKQKPEDCINKGMGFISEDRKGTGLLLTMNVKENMTLPSLKMFKKLNSFFVDESKEEVVVNEKIDSLRVKTPSIHQKIDKLSGGNQQKVLIARWLLLTPKLLIMDEPTRGIDVGGKSEIYQIMGNLVKMGVSIVMISSEIPELLAMSDRIMVMREGRNAGILSEMQKTEENILKLAFGGKLNE